MSELGSHIYYHIVVSKDGSHKQYRRLNERPRATRENNDWIHIAMEGNFNKEKPTREQLLKVQQLVDEIRTEYGDLKVYEHGELQGESSGCAGKNFDTSLLAQPVIIEGKGDQASKIASYAYNLCKGYTGDVEMIYWCKDMVLTFNAENRNWLYNTVSAKNENGTRDHGICQLNDKYHTPFISTREFLDAYSQVDYCFEVWIDANRKKKMPWRGYYVKEERGVNVAFNW